MTEFCPSCDSAHITGLSLTSRATVPYTVPYGHCQDCDLIFIDPAFLLSSSEEKARYENHENIEGNADYEKFLAQLWVPLQKYLGDAKAGIDFGSGPGPALQKMIQRAGFECEIYDPYYAVDQSVLAKKYDFVVSTEVVEHFNFPKTSWAQLLSLVKPGGYLGVMTQFHPGGAKAAEFFKTWWYARDPAHVSFYSEKTLRQILNHAGFEILELRSPIVIARRSSVP